MRAAAARQSTNLAIKSKKKSDIKALQAIQAGTTLTLHGGSSLQVLLDLGGVFSVEALGFLVELGVPLVDVVDVGVVVVGSAPAEFGALLDSGRRKTKGARHSYKTLI